MLKLPENHVKTILGIFFFKFLNLKKQYFWNFDQKVKKHDFLPKNHFFGIFWHFLVKIFKNIAYNSKIWKNLFLEKYLNMIFKQF